LAFPGAYAPTGLIGDGPNSAGWFFVLWHTTFPLMLLAYTFLKDTNQPRASVKSPAASIAVTVVSVFVKTGVLTCIVTAQVAWLPTLYQQNEMLQSLFAKQINGAMLVWDMIVLIVLF